MTDVMDHQGAAKASESPWAIETHDLTKRFGERVAVNGVDLLVPRGCAFGYLGPNGAGKTTLIRVLLGLTHADAGSMELLGYPVPRHRDVALARVGAIVDEPRFHPHLTGRENLQILAAAREPAASTRIDAALERVAMSQRANDKVAKYSMGMRQRLGVAACLLGDPHLLILDEPMNGLDPAGMADMREMIRSLVAEGRTVVLSSHLLDEIERTCDAVAIVDQGRIIRQGPINELLAGSNLEVEIDCESPDVARSLLTHNSFDAQVTVVDAGVHVSLPVGTTRDVVAEMNRILVTGGVSVFRLQENRPSLEAWFLEVTSRFGGVRMTLPAANDQLFPGLVAFPDDHRGRPYPTWAMIATRIMELRKRRGLMVALVGVNIGIPVVYLSIRLIMHIAAPKSYSPAGGYDSFTNLVAGVMFIFGFIVAATLGCTAGSVDLSEGVFRHSVVTGRSRIALYLTRIPAGLAILVPIVAAGFVVVCAVCVFAAPTKLNYQGVTVPSGLSRAQFVTWAEQNAQTVDCQFPYNFTSNGTKNFIPACGSLGGNGGSVITRGGTTLQQATPAQMTTLAVDVANQDYLNYSQTFLSPPLKLMVQSGLWLELETIIGFVVGLGLGSLMGSRTVPTVLMIILEIVLTPILSVAHIPHLMNLQRGVVGLATAHLEPSGLPSVFGGHGPGAGGIIPESTTVAIIVIIGWLVGWTVLGVWRMSTRDV